METAVKNLKITVNGTSIRISEGAIVTDLLKELDLNSTMVAVELNGKILPKTEYKACKLNDGDVLEVVHFVGGG